ncbi:MAG: hypothetical protein IKR42_04405 [Campylobacter sp.]|nr:hypothetical protein [Campylobacter sp.]
MNNENIMREKAEQMAKNAEIKIQKAQTKEAKYQQWLENKKQTDPNFRDYDENPLIIKSYEKFFVLTLNFSSFYLGFAFFCLIANLINKAQIKTAIGNKFINLLYFRSLPQVIKNGLASSS